MNKSKYETAILLRLLQKIVRYLSIVDLRIQAVLKYRHKAGEFISGLFSENEQVSFGFCTSYEFKKIPYFLIRKVELSACYTNVVMKSSVIPGKTLIFLKV